MGRPPRLTRPVGQLWYFTSHYGTVPKGLFPSFLESGGNFVLCLGRVLPGARGVRPVARGAVPSDRARSGPLRGGTERCLPNRDENGAGSRDRTPLGRGRSGARAVDRQRAPLRAAVSRRRRQSIVGVLRRTRHRAMADAERPASVGTRTARDLRLARRPDGPAV